MKNRLLGIGSFACPVLVLLVLVAAISLPLFVDMENEIPVHLRSYVIFGMLLTFVAVTGTWFFIIYDIIHAARNPSLTGGAKAGWICAIWFLNIFAIPIFYMKFLRITAETDKAR